MPVPVGAGTAFLRRDATFQVFKDPFGHVSNLSGPVLQA